MPRIFKKKPRKEKKKISKSAIFAIIIGAIMILSTIGFSLSGSLDETRTYKGFKLIRGPSYWLLDQVDEKYIQEHPLKAKILKPINYPGFPRKRFYFSYLPEGMEKMDVDKDAIAKIKDSKMVYVSFYPDSTGIDSQYIDFARFQIAKDLFDNFRIYAIQGKTEVPKDDLSNNLTSSAVYDANIAKLDIPLINCMNATSAIPVIMIKSRLDNTSLKMENNCIFVNANRGEDLVLLRDRILYGLLGVV